MGGAANEHYFSQPHWRVIAQGFQTENWFNDGQAVGTGGIGNPQPIHLPVGQYYYRFASSHSPRDVQLGGGSPFDKLSSTSSLRQAQGERTG